MELSYTQLCNSIRIGILDTVKKNTVLFSEL